MRLLISAAALLAVGLSAPAQAADKVNFQFGWLPGGDRGAYYLAKEEGLFAAENLEVTLIPGRGSTDAITKIATGAADMGEAGLDALLTAQVKGDVPPVVAVMSVYTKAPDALATTAKTGIKSLADLKGKTVATSPFTSSNGPWPFLLQLNGINPDDVKLIKADPSALPAMLATGKADGIIQYVTNAPATGAIIKESGSEMLMIPWSDYGLDGYSSSILTSEAYLSKNRDVVVRFTHALKKAEEMMKADPAKAAAAVKAAVPEVDVKVQEAVAIATLPLIFNEHTEKAGLGIFEPERVKTTWEWVAKQQGVEVGSRDPMTSIDMTIAGE